MPKFKTTEQFIEDARKVHGNRYDYSLVEYVDSKSKVRIICPEHGEFLKTPAHHLQGQGCPACAGKKRLDTSSFVERARLVHGDKYDYSKVEYSNIFNKVCIICPEHGMFYQVPKDHLSGKGCPKCGNIERGISKHMGYVQSYVRRARMVHGDKYDYSKSDIVGADCNIEIICPIHGSFFQNANNHLRGKGCPKCAKAFMDDEYFRGQAQRVHHGKYGYDKVNYHDAHTNVEIECPIHGSFWQTPNRHLQGGGCPLCAQELLSDKFRKPMDEFLADAKRIHGGKYDYSSVEYKNNRDKVTIICPIHGPFKQSVGSHLGGAGCPICSESHLEREVRLFLVNNRIPFEYEKHFPWLGYQSLDFYLPHENVAIECQGKQHFEDTSYAGMWRSFNFERQKELDSRKKQLCKENNLKVLYFGESGRENFMGESLISDLNTLLQQINKINSDE